MVPACTSPTDPSALRLATFVAEEFEIEILPADYVIENFLSVAAIAEFVRRATAR